MRLSALLALLLLLLPSMPAPAEAPTFSEVVGREFGERITVHPEMVRYVERLGEVSDRVTVIDQGESWEGRRLLLAVVTSPENHRRLVEIQETAQRLGDPRGLSPEQAAALIEGQPVIAWLGGSIHGNELSGSEGLLKLLERLATADDEATLRVLREAVVLIDPMLNPDGRDAFAHHNHQRLGHAPNPRPEDWGNDADRWDGVRFRTGHYFFDTNRDWFAHTQRETLHRVPTLQAWRPQVVLDAHEMGRGLEFYFDPPNDPVAPTYPEFASRWFEVFGDAYAATFDEQRWEYTTRDLFNFFYPGYTTSYGSYQGGVGMLFEQGSSRGLALERGDGSVRTLAEALENQYQGAWTTVSTAVEERRRFLTEYVEAHRAAVADGAQGVRRYLLPEGSGDPGVLEEAVALLRRNGIEVGRLSEDTQIGGLRDRTGQAASSRSFAAGTYVVEAAQPRNRLIRALLEPTVPVPEDFLREARGRVDRGENPRFYDLTAWSLPLLFHLEAYGSTASTAAGALSVEAVQEAPGPTTPNLDGEEPYAYLLDGRRATSVAAAHHLRRQGFRITVTTRPSRIEGQDIPGGSVVVRNGQEGLKEALEELSRQLPLVVTTAATGKADAGFPALHHSRHPRLKPTTVALLAGSPVSGYSFGWSWYTLDRRYRIPVTVLEVDGLARKDLRDFDSLVIPDLSSAEALSKALGEEGRERLERWVREGGTLVALGDAVDFVRRGLQLGSLRSWYPEGEGEKPGSEPEDQPQKFTIPGAFFRVELNLENGLTAGYDSADLPVLVESNRLYLPPDGPPSDQKRVVARYAAEGAQKLSGHAWAENLERIGGAVYLYEERIGQGRILLFAEDPNYRAYTRGTERLFLNAVLLGPSAP